MAPESLLIVAGSGRMLAEAAHKAGWRPLVIDLYADIDTRRLAMEIRRVPALALEHVKPAVEELIGRHAVSQAVYGSGLEYFTETLDYLDKRMTVWGNAPRVFRDTQNKPVFFSTLASMNISFPQTAFMPPGSGRGWLIKPFQGQGGQGIWRYEENRPFPNEVYWQRFQRGTSCSVLFLANGRDARVIGLNTQIAVKLIDGHEFAFGGLVNHVDLGNGLRSQIARWVKECTHAFALKGLNSLDFIHEEEHAYVLEINPRPSASMQLYDNMLNLHIGASKGCLPDDLSAQREYAGFQIVYADADLSIPVDFAWPDWTQDRPEAGIRCRSGQPVCSVNAYSKEPGKVWTTLAARQQQIINHLSRLN